MYPFPQMYGLIANMSQNLVKPIIYFLWGEGGGVKFLPLFENLPILLLPWPANVNLDNVLKIYVSASDLGIKKSTKSILFLTFQRYFRYLFTFFCALSLQQTLILIFFSKTSIIPFFLLTQYSTVQYIKALFSTIKAFPLK